MGILDWVFLSMIIAAIFTAFLFLLFIGRAISSKKEYAKLSKKRAKNKTQKKKLHFLKKRVEVKKKKQRNKAILFFVMTLLLGSGGAYTLYYQSMNLTMNDSDSIVQGYYVLKDFEQELDKIEKQSGSREKLEGNIKYLTGVMATYGIKKASTLNTEEGQLALNRYYNILQEIGTNGTTMISQLYGNPEKTGEFKADIEKAKRYQKKVFQFYKVDEADLQKKE